jgi:hypothetical protein
MNAPLTRRLPPVETAFARAFMVALAKWSAHHTETDKITIPHNLAKAADVAGERPPANLVVRFRIF